MLRRTLVLLAVGALSACVNLHAADDPVDAEPEKVVEDLVEEQAEKGESEVEGADPGEASYNTENCEEPGEPVDGEVQAQDLDEACKPLIK